MHTTIQYVYKRSDLCICLREFVYIHIYVCLSRYASNWVPPMLYNTQALPAIGTHTCTFYTFHFFLFLFYVCVIRLNMRFTQWPYALILFSTGMVTFLLFISKWDNYIWLAFAAFLFTHAWMDGWMCMMFVMHRIHMQCYIHMNAKRNTNRSNNESFVTYVWFKLTAHQQ